MTAGSADQNGPSGQDVVFTLDRGYRRPQRNRGAAFAVLAVLAAVVAVVAGRRIGADVAWGFAAAFGAFVLGYAVRYALIGRFRTRLSPQGIEIRGYFDHFVPWSDVTGVEVTGAEATGLILSGSTRDMHVTETDPARKPQLLDQAVAQGDSYSGVRARLATVRVARAHGHRLLLRAPLVTAWQSDPGFGDKVRVIREWWQAYGDGTVKAPPG